MALRPHLPLRRLEGELERRKRPGFSTAPDRDNTAHGAQLRTELEHIVAKKVERNDPAEDPTIILKINGIGYLDDDSLAGAGLQILAQRPEQTTVVLAVDPKLAVLQERTALYAGPIPAQNKNASYANLFDVIESFGELAPNEKIGSALIRHGFTGIEFVPDDDIFLVDVELWDPIDNVIRELYIDRVRLKAQHYGGEFLSRYLGAGLFIARVRIPGTGLKQLLSMNEVGWIDLPPVPDFAPDPAADLTLDEIPPIDPPSEGSLCIGVIDSGINSAHPMLAGVVSGTFGVPGHLGSDDERRHGTAVASVAAYGSILAHIEQGRLSPRFRIASAKVVDVHGKFVEDRTVADIIEEAIRRLHGEYGCRVINISLADVEHLVGDRPSNWAMVLDNLVRELGLIITISCGNIQEISARLLQEGLGIYPSYLLEDRSRLYEPASSVNSLVIGSLAHSNGLMAGDEDNADIVAITEPHHPSPFSRSGPGFGGSIKPDLVEYGGTAVWLGHASTLSADRPSCGVLTLNPTYLQSLLTYRHGTSFAAPFAAFKAAALLEEFPHVSANSIRALMGLSASYPPALLERVMSESGRDALRHAGYGVANLDMALASENSRVVLTVEDSLPVDRFAVYEVPIPTDYQTVKGRRHIKVSLAFDPPVRNSRREYLGTKMGYHLVRGKSVLDVFDRFRKWEKEEKDQNGGAFNFDGTAWKCDMKPLATTQEAGTLQVGTFTAQRDISKYGDNYYLVVRCEGKWASHLVEAQTFAIAVELWHEVPLDLYQTIAVTLGV